MATSFCNSEFWDPSLLSNVSVPQFSQCFQDTIVVYVPCGYLWLASLFYTIYFSRSQCKFTWRDFSILAWLRTILGFVLCCILAADLIVTVLQSFDGNMIPVATMLRPAILCLTLILSEVLTYKDYIHGSQQSGVLAIFWLLLFLAGIIPASQFILKAMEQNIPHLPSFILYFVYYGLVLLAFFLSLLPDPPKKKTTANQEEVLHLSSVNLLPSSPGGKATQPCPELSASFLSRVTYWWMSSVIVRGYKKSLTRDDLYAVRPEDKSNLIADCLQNNWDKQIRTNYNVPIDSSSHEQKVTSYSPSHSTRVTKPSLIKALLHTFGPYYALAGLYKLIHDVLAFVGPQLLSSLIDYIESENQSAWLGYCLAVGLFLASFLQSIMLQQYFVRCFIVGMRVRAAVSSTVFKKSLKLSGSSRKSCTTGQIVNLISIDSQKLYELAGQLHFVWSTPLIMIGCLVFLWQLLSWAALAGIGAMIVLVPINAVIANKQKVLQTHQMKKKDTRLKWINEIISGIKVIKLYAWEIPFKSRISDTRKEELDILKRFSYLNAGSAFTWMCAPYLVSLVTFAVYVSISDENILDAKKAFVALSLFNILRYPLSSLQNVIAALVQARVSLTRLEDFLNKDELESEQPVHDSLANVSKNKSKETTNVCSAGDSLCLQNVSYAWDSQSPPFLKNMNLKVQHGELIAVVGEVGSGKSSLISAILGEMYKTEGCWGIRGSVAYVPQQAWIQNATLQENIIFGRSSINESLYNEVVDACALTPDVAMLPGGHQTEIGEKGINVSGGQKQRISLARAVYADADIYLLDDPLSAVDAHVGSHIFDHVIGPQGLLSRKTRLLVTHNIACLPHVGRILVLSNGVISEMGTYQELLANNGDFAKFLKQHQKEATTSEGSSEENNVKITRLSKEKNDNAGEKTKHKLEGSKIVQEEKSAEGKIKSSLLFAYLRAFGWISSFVIVLSFVIFNGVSVYSSIWLAMWSSDPVLNGTAYEDLRDLRLGVYGGLGLAQALAVLCQSMALAVGSVAASSGLHKNLLNNILRSPMSFFETTPTGRIINRFSKDVDAVDVKIPLTISLFMVMTANVLATIIVISYSTPVMLAVFVPLFICYLVLQRFYISASRQMMRIESVCRSPIYSTTEECVLGAPSIRAYKQQDRFISIFNEKNDNHVGVFYANVIANRWLGVRLEFIGNCIVLFAAIFAIIFRETISGGLVGLSVSYALQVTFALNYMVRKTSDLETDIIAVERIQEYIDTPTEAPWQNKHQAPDSNWPHTGCIEFNHYSTRYRPGLDLVLNDLSCAIKPGEKVGIVGRTGAGKSSLTLALFRIIEPSSGKILIDGADVSQMGLHDLRSRLSIIPQDPVLFIGSLRLNLDPYNKHSDNDLWSALQLSHLDNFVRSRADRLDHQCAEGGANLSIGQRQQVCLARALLRKSRILVLDEATAAIDLTTDSLIQETIRAQFAQCTIITIAHRINTILDYDRVMVLDTGEIKEFDTPESLLRDNNSMFYSLAKDAGLC